jgi:predicted DNA-binding protein with PD1-like motif
VKYRKEGDRYLIVLDKGDEVVESLTAFVTDAGISGGSVRGIGGVTGVELGFFDIDKREYLRRKLDGFYELACLLGDVSLVDGKPFCHLHAVISDTQMRASAGHLFRAEVSVTAEIFLTPGEEARRAFDGRIGLNLLDI